jgi:hypothetical protein
MLITNKSPLVIIIVLLTLTFSSCLGASDPSVNIEEQVQAVIAATLTKEAFLKSVDTARRTAVVEDEPTPTFTEVIPPTETNTPTVTPSPTPTPKPVHQVLPGSPSSFHFIIPDIVTVDLAKDKTAIGDSYAWSRLERPYTSKRMVYKSYLDIYQVMLTGADTWFYITFVMIGNLPEEADVHYSVELDVDHDGAGDFLVSAALPPNTEWTTDNVWVYTDEDDDIGGLYPLYMEEEALEQNGYEREIYASGEGTDPDLAWVRRDPDNRNRLQLAFKRSLTGSLGFMWSAWADEGIKDPGLYDFNDHFTYVEAGSPNTGNYRYPVKAVSLIDSTCRAWYDFVPNGEEPGLCYAGDMYVELEGYGWCEAKPKQSGCEPQQCKDKCPADKFCVPCKLP